MTSAEGRPGELKAPSASDDFSGATAELAAAAEKPTLIFRPTSFVERINLNRLFPQPQPVEVELGSGDGSFLAKYAASNPTRNFIGVERLLGRLRKLDRKGLRAGLGNLRLIRVEASYFIEYLLPAESICAVHIYFPDPWPKRRHHKNRLINQRFSEMVGTVLRPGGAIFLRTDNPEYFAQMTSVFQGNAAFESFETTASLRNIQTDFERDFEAKGIPTLRAAYRRLE